MFRFAIASTVVTPVEGIACQFKPESAVVAALMNLQTGKAASLARSLEMDSTLIPSGDFYVALANWYRAYQEEDSRKKSVAIADLRDALGGLEQTARDQPNPGSLLAAGVAGGHTARILFDSKKYLPGYRIAQRARKRLEGFLATAKPEHPGMPDARLLEGLFELYSYDLRQRASWLPRSFRYQGNRDRGLMLVEQAITGGAAFGYEAIRALLAEVPWRTPDFCRYMSAIDRAGSALPDNRDIAILRQGLMLKCGHNGSAERVNQEYFSLHQGDPAWEFLTRARWRISASLGAVDAIVSADPDESALGHYRLALANAYDVNGRRDAALRLYEELRVSPGLDSAIKSAAAVRTKYPFRAPDKVVIAQLGPAFGGGCNATPR